MVIQFKYYVLNYNHNKQQIELYNIFNNIHVQEWTERAVKKYIRSPKNFTYKSYSYSNDLEVITGFAAFVRELDGIIAWQERGRSEYEMSCGYKFETDCNKLQATDCYEQAHLNIEIIAREVIRAYKQYLKNSKDGE